MTMEANEKLKKLCASAMDAECELNDPDLPEVCALLTADVAMAYRKFVADGDWIESTNDLWYQKSDGNPSEGITEEQLFVEFMNQYQPSDNGK